MTTIQNKISVNDLTFAIITKSTIARLTQLLTIWFSILLLQLTITNEHLQFINESWYFRIPFWLLLFNFAGIAFSITINHKKFKTNFIDTVTDKFIVNPSNVINITKYSNKLFKVLFRIFAVLFAFSVTIFMFYSIFSIFFMSKNLTNVIWFLYVILKIQIVFFGLNTAKLISYRIRYNHDKNS